jgi:hypothetical protein
LRHHVACHYSREIVPRCRSAAGDIAVGDHADEPVVFTDRNTSDAIVSHDTSNFRDWYLGRDPLHMAAHDFLYEHSFLLLQVGDDFIAVAISGPALLGRVNIRVST